MLYKSEFVFVFVSERTSKNQLAPNTLVWYVDDLFEILEETDFIKKRTTKFAKLKVKNNCLHPMDVDY